MTARQVSLRINPEAALRVAEERTVPHIPLFANQPFAIVGARRVPPIATTGVTPDESCCFGPRGAALLGRNGPLWVCDTGHHRLLGWREIPSNDLQPADLLIGQPSCQSEGRNGKGDADAKTVNVPTGICTYGGGMAVADAWNHRVLIWTQLPESNNQPADFVVGQADFQSVDPNRGMSAAAADRFHWPYGVAYFEGKLFVADAGNRRVLVWDEPVTANGQPANYVLGQHEFACRDENAGGDPGAMSMRWPHDVALWCGNLCVTDAGNNRIMVWNGIPGESGVACDFVLGQASASLVDHNQSCYWPRASTLNMPYGIVAVSDWLIAADTANSRLIGWHTGDLETNAPARALAGQTNFHEKGDNRWQPAQADSVCWPYGVNAFADTVVVADSGNNRVSLWRLAT